MGLTPNLNECLKATNVQKMNIQGLWCDRALYLTENEISIALPGATHIKDKVPLEMVRLVSSRNSEDGVDSLGTTDMLKSKSLREWERIAAATDSECFDVDAVFIVHAKAEDGTSEGRPYSFRARTQSEKEEWIREINKAVCANPML